MTNQAIPSDPKRTGDAEGVEPLLTIQQAADELHVYAWAIRRTIKAGGLRAYTPFNSRKLVRLSDVIAFINASQIGGAK